MSAELFAAMFDPRDRSENEPCLLVSPAQVLKFYNKVCPTAYRVTDEIKQVFVDYAERAGWGGVSWPAHGNQCLLMIGNIPSCTVVSFAHSDDDDVVPVKPNRSIKPKTGEK